jgi:hypothetical protein
VVGERFGGSGLAFPNSRASLALALAERGEFVEAVVRCTEAIQIAEVVGHPYTVPVMYTGMGLVHLTRGDLHQANLALDHALEICQGVDSPSLFHGVRSTLGYAFACSGRSDEGIPLLEEGVERPATMIGIAEGKSLQDGMSQVVGRLGDLRFYPHDVLIFEDVKNVAIATWASIGITADRGSQILQRLYEHGRCAEAAAEYTFLSVR